MQHMPILPNKFGIKFLLLHDVSSNFLCNKELDVAKDLLRSKESVLLADVFLMIAIAQL